jgi:hypothetical protein
MELLATRLNKIGDEIVRDNAMRTMESAMTKSIGSAGAAKATGGAATIESVANIIEREL